MLMLASSSSSPRHRGSIERGVDGGETHALQQRGLHSITSSVSASSMGGTSHLTPPPAGAELARLYKTLLA